MKIHFQKTLAVILTAVTIITSFSINTMAVYAAESKQITKSDIANAIAQKRGLYCAPTFIQEFVVNLDEAVNYFNQKAQEQAEWNDIAVATAQEIKDSTTLQEKIETIYDAAVAETKSVYTCFDAVFGTVKRAFSPEVKAELMKDGNGGFILNYATHDPSKSVNALGKYGLTKDDYFDYEKSNSVAVYDEFVDSISTDIVTYIGETEDYYLIRIPSWQEYGIFDQPSSYCTLKAYHEMQTWFNGLETGEIYTLYNNTDIASISGIYMKWNQGNYAVFDSAHKYIKFYTSDLYEVESNNIYTMFLYNSDDSYNGVYTIPYEYFNNPDVVTGKDYSYLESNTANSYSAYIYAIRKYPETYSKYLSGYGYDASDYNKYSKENFYNYPSYSTGIKSYYTFSKTPVTLKVYKDLDKVVNNKKPQVYYSENVYSNYDSSVDNSVTYNADVNNGYIYTNIDNSVTTGMTEAEVQELIVSILENTSSGSGTGGSGGSGNGGSGSGGSGILDLVGGLGSLGNTLLSLLGNIIEIASGFIKQLGDIITGLTTGLQESTGQVGEMIASFFPFIPPEIISAITLGIVAIILIAVIKQIKG